jgi:hypothetical protein
VAAFHQGLKDAGFVEGQNLTIEYRWADGQYDRLAVLAADLIQRKVAVIAATSTPAAVAAKAATSTIPIVFTTGGDPIKLGLVASLNRPGGNVTGVSNMLNEMASKRLGLLREFVPANSVIAHLVNPSLPDTERQLADVEATARGLGLQLITLRASDEREIDAAFAAIAQRGVGALLVGADAFLTARRDQIVLLAARGSVPALYPSGLCRRGRPDELRHQPRGFIPPMRHLCRPDYQGRKAGRSAGAALQQVRIRDQRQDRKGPGPVGLERNAIARRRGDRIVHVRLLHLLTTAPGRFC